MALPDLDWAIGHFFMILKHCGPTPLNIGTSFMAPYKGMTSAGNYLQFYQDLKI